MRRFLLVVATLCLLVGAASAAINITEYGVALYSTDSQNPAPQFVVANVGDLNNNTVWASDGDPTNIYIRADFGAGVNRVVNNYTLKVNPLYAAQVPLRWFLRASNDAVNWDTLHDHSSAYGYHLTSPNTSYTSSTTTQGAYRYYQLDIIDCEPTAAYATLGELVLANETFDVAPSTGAIPDFIAIPNVSAQYGMKVQFTNTTTIPGSTTFNWTFGDGNRSSWYETDFNSDVSKEFTVSSGSAGEWTLSTATGIVSHSSSGLGGAMYMIRNQSFGRGKYVWTVRTPATIDGTTRGNRLVFCSDSETNLANDGNKYYMYLRYNSGGMYYQMTKIVAGVPANIGAQVNYAFVANKIYVATMDFDSLTDTGIFTFADPNGTVLSTTTYSGTLSDFNYGYTGFAAVGANEESWLHAIRANPINTNITYDTSTLANPSYTYDVAGRYSVTMNATNSTGFNRIYKQWEINLTSDTDNYLKSRIHFLGSPGSVYVKGDEGLAWSSGSFSISNTQFKFNQTSGAFLNPNSFISTPSTPILDFGIGDFTIEQWVYPLTTGADYVLVSRSSSNTLSDGWGIYHGAGAASDDWHFYMGDRATNASTAFTIPLNTWSHVVVMRKDGIVTVYVNGVAVTTPVSRLGPYDVTTPLVYGDPNVGVRSFDGYLDETGYSTGVARWDGAHTSPYAEYRGDLFPTYPDPNPDSILRFKTDPADPSVATISNLTARNRTVQIQNVEIANNLSATITFDPNHLFPKRVLPNATVFDGINFTQVEIHPGEGTVMINLTRPGGFHIVGGTRTSVADIEFVYWNYTEPSNGGVEFFGDGFLKNSTSGIDYPIDTFIQTNVTYFDWKTFSNFTMNSTTPVINTPVQMFTELNYTANAFTIDWGDGISETITHRNPNHTYTSIGTKDISLTAFVLQNVSVTNTTLRLGAVNVTLADDTIIADFVASDMNIAPSSLVTFTSTSIIANATNVIYNWSFGDGGYAQNATSANHVYTYSGVYTVTLLVYNVNLYGESTDFETKLDYIIVAQSEDFLMKYPPEPVRFRVQTVWGQAIPGATVNVTGITTSLGNWDWVAQLLGYPLDEVPFNTEPMIETTDDDGTVVFLLIKSSKYNITTTASGYTFTPMILAPDANSYPIYADINGTSWFQTGNNTLEQVNVTISTSVINTTHGFINVTYEDYAVATTGGTITVLKDNVSASGPMVIYTTFPVESNSFTNSTIVEIPQGGTSYQIQVEAESSITEIGTIERTFNAWFKGQQVELAGFDSTILLWFSLFCIIFTAMFAGAHHAPQIAIIICIESWVFWAIGWLDPLADSLNLRSGLILGQGVLIVMLTIATMAAVWWNFREGKRKEKGT